MNSNYCIHPGVIMKSILTSIGKSQTWLATEMHMSKTLICDLFKGKRTVTANIARAFEIATGFPADLLLQQQNKYNLFKIEDVEQKPAFAQHHCNNITQPHHCKSGKVINSKNNHII